MNEKYLGDALLRGEDPIDLNALTRRVLRRDRRRMWILGILCVIAWMLVVMLPWATTLPMLAKVAETSPEMNRQITLDHSSSPPASISLAEVIKKGTIATFLSSLASMFVAAIFTVSFVTLSRRATLRQVNSRLMEISVQLQSLAGSRKQGD